ncbi:transglycosylase SLT domain-containing protein [Acinetobacter soli]|uniref:transglycosylase SLT domain-containing protein n=1 Tax=Acinetobacter soli TaxID=487316 RepID=UPI00124E4DC1|nr:lytic transglycosylase domain-containing protein [Acinetobacter soli]
MANNKIEVHISAKTSELKSGMNDAEEIVQKTAKDIEVIGQKIDFKIDTSGIEKSFRGVTDNISSQFITLGKNIAAGLGSAIAIDGLMDLGKNAINTATEVKRMSELVGESVEDFQYLAAGAQTAGLSLDQFGQMGKDALEKLGEARRGEGEMMDFFDKVAPKIGVTIDMFKDLSGPEVIQAYYDGLQKANLSHADTITYMEQIVNDGSLLIPLLKDGGAGFKKWGDEAQKAGAIMSKDMVANLGVAKDNLYKLQLQFQGFQATLINTVTPVVTAIANNMENIKAVAIALGAAISAKLIVQFALLTKEFAIGLAQGVAYEMQLAALQGQTLRTATAMGVLRSMSALLGGPAGLAMLAVQGVAAGAAFLYMKRSSDDVLPSLSAQGKTIAELRAEYEKLDKAQQRVLTRQATADLSKSEQAFRKQEIALLGLVRAVINHSDASDIDKKAAKDMYDQYIQGKLNADQLATGINNLRTVEAKHKQGIDEKANALNEERKALINAEGVLKSYNSVTKQGTKDNQDHTKSIDDKANALANLTAKQMDYVRESRKGDAKEDYAVELTKQGFSREKADFYANKKQESDTPFNVAMPSAVRAAVEADWKREQATKAREESEKKAQEKLKEQTKELEKQQQILHVNERVKVNAKKFNYSDLESKHGLPNGMLSAIDMQESRGKSNAVGPMTKYGTAKGNFQLLDGTAKRFGVNNPFDTKQAADGAAKYLRFLLDKYGDIDKAVSAYHAGEGNVDRGTRIGPVNRQYVKNVKGYIAGVNGVEVGTDASAYDKSLQEQVHKADDAEKEKLALQYKYAGESKQVAIDLNNEISKIENSTLSGDEKINSIVLAEAAASEKVRSIYAEQFEKIKEIREQEIANAIEQAQRIFDVEKASIQALLDANKISNAQKVQMEKQLEDQLRAIKRNGLEERLKLEEQYSSISGKGGNQSRVTNDIANLDTDQKVANTQSFNLMSEAQMKDFEKKFGGLTDRISSLWDKGIQSMMNGTLTWKNATNAVMTDMAGYFIQKMVTEPLRQYMVGLARRLAVRLGFIKTETAVEVAGQAAQTGAVVAGETTKTMATSTGALARLAIKAGETIKTIMMYAWEAMAGAFKAMVSIPYIGPVLAVGAGAAALALVGGIAGKVKSARGGYDIPAGVNPMTQLHEEEMVLPKQHANTIRALGKSMANGGFGSGGENTAQPVIFSPTIQAWDSKDVRRYFKKHGSEIADSLKGYKRNFGK